MVQLRMSWKSTLFVKAKKKNLDCLFKEYLFDPYHDLTEMKNIPKVTRCLAIIGKMVKIAGIKSRNEIFAGWKTKNVDHVAYTHPRILVFISVEEVSPNIEWQSHNNTFAKNAVGTLHSPV